MKFCCFASMFRKYNKRQEFWLNLNLECFMTETNLVQASTNYTAKTPPAMVIRKCRKKQSTSVI